MYIKNYAIENLILLLFLLLIFPFLLLRLGLAVKLPLEIRKPYVYPAIST